MNSQLEQTAGDIEQYTEQHLFDAQGIMYSGIDGQTNQPFHPALLTPATVPRRAEFDAWSYWTYEDSVICMGLYIDGLVRKYEVTQDARCLERAHSLWRVLRNVYSCSQVYGIGSFLRPYGGYEGMNTFVEPLGTDQASPMFSGMYLYQKDADDTTKAQITNMLLQSLNWYERQGFEYFYYKCFIHEWNVTYQHAASYYLQGIAWAAQITGEQRWRDHLTAKMALFQQEGFTLFGHGQGSFCWGSDIVVLADIMGDDFTKSITAEMLRSSYENCQARLAEYTEPGYIKRIFPESAEPGFKPYLKPGFKREEGMGFAYFYSVHGGRQRPRHEVHFLCALAALGYPGALEQAADLLSHRKSIPLDFTDYMAEDYDKLPEEVRLFARSISTGLVEWFRNYWLLRWAEANR